MNKFREEQENTNFPAVSKFEENNQTILDMTRNSSIQYLKNAQQKQKEKQHFQIVKATTATVDYQHSSFVIQIIF